MTDRELLKAAAKAVGIKVEWRKSAKCLCYSNSPYEIAWNPMQDDGDALKLFCRLPWMCIETSDVGVSVRERVDPVPGRVYLMWTEMLEDHGGHMNSATRRAIVMAAAAMVKP